MEETRSFKDVLGEMNDALPEEATCGCGKTFKPRNRFDLYCPACLAVAVAEEAKRADEERRLDAFRARGVGERFWGKTLANFDPGKYNGAVLQACTHFCEHGFGQEDGAGLYLHGQAGTGKTHLAVGVLMRFRRPGLIVNSIALLDTIKSSYNGEETDVERNAARSPLLVLDDLGAERVTEWVLERFYLLINERYWHKRPTVYTSNMSTSELEKRMALMNRELAERIVSRIDGTSHVLHVRGRDRRRAQ